MNGVFGALPERRRQGEIQRALAVVSGVLATDQILKWLLSDSAGVHRAFDPVLWQAAISIAALAVATIALAYFMRRGQISAAVVGLMIGGLTSVTIDTLAGSSVEFGFVLGSIADLAIATGFLWGAASLVLTGTAHRSPTASVREHRLAA